MRSSAKSGSPVALLSQGSVTDIEREEIISPISSFPLCISACVCGTLSLPPPLSPRTIFFYGFARFLSIFCCYLLLVFESLLPHTLDSLLSLILSVMEDFQ